jgi:hypothetical protein
MNPVNKHCDHYQCTEERYKSWPWCRTHCIGNIGGNEGLVAEVLVELLEEVKGLRADLEIRHDIDQIKLKALQ